MINYVVAFGLLLSIMLAFSALVRGAPTKLLAYIYVVCFSLILVGASFPALVEVAPHLISWLIEVSISAKNAIVSVM